MWIFISELTLEALSQPRYCRLTITDPTPLGQPYSWNKSVGSFAYRYSYKCCSVHTQSGGLFVAVQNPHRSRLYNLVCVLKNWRAFSCNFIIPSSIIDLESDLGSSNWIKKRECWSALHFFMIREITKKKHFQLHYYKTHYICIYSKNRHSKLNMLCKYLRDFSNYLLRDINNNLHNVHLSYSYSVCL